MVTEKIEKIMKEKNMKQADLARLLFDIPETEPVPAKYRVRISDYLTHKTNMPLDIIEKVSKVLNVEISELLNRNTPIPITKSLPVLGTGNSNIPHGNYHDREKYEFMLVPDQAYKTNNYILLIGNNANAPKIKKNDLIVCDPDAVIENNNFVHFNYKDDKGIGRVQTDNKGEIKAIIVGSGTNEGLLSVFPENKEELKVVKCVLSISPL